MVDTLDAANMDLPPTTAQKAEESEKLPLPEPNSPWKVYLRPYWLSLILNNTKLVFGLLMGFWYLA